MSWTRLIFWSDNEALVSKGAVLNGLRLVRGVLRILWIGMLVLGSLSMDVTRDGQVNITHVVVPVEGDATE